MPQPLIIFPHIPKTAGSSFRRAAEAYFGPDRVLRDYGPEASVTSELVRERLYKRNDPAGFIAELKVGQFRMLAGHFNRSKFEEMLPDAVMVSWVREPVSRLWSSYGHWTRHHGFEGSFQAFYEQLQRRNQQSRTLGGGLEGFAFIGLTERFNEDLQAFNHRFDTALEPRRDNRAPGSDTASGPTPEDHERIRELNPADVALYSSAETFVQTGVAP